MRVGEMHIEGVAVSALESAARRRAFLRRPFFAQYGVLFAGRALDFGATELAFGWHPADQPECLRVADIYFILLISL